MAIKYGKILGTVVTVIALAVVTTMAKAEKVKWDKNGKIIRKKSTKPTKGCKQDLSFLDSNKTLVGSYNPADMFTPKKECKQ